MLEQNVSESQKGAIENLIKLGITDIRDVPLGEEALANISKKTIDVPVYGVFLEVNNETKNRNIYAYTK